jgi:hypothetical protein
MAPGKENKGIQTKKSVPASTKKIDKDTDENFKSAQPASNSSTNQAILEYFKNFATKDEGMQVLEVKEAGLKFEQVTVKLQSLERLLRTIDTKLDLLCN